MSETHVRQSIVSYLLFGLAFLFFFFSSFLLYPQFACHLIQRPHTNGKPIIHPFLTWTFTGILPRHFLAWHTMHASAHFCTWIGKPNLILISRLVDMKITFNLKGINLQTVRSRELPDCYSFSVTVWLKLILAHDWVQKAEKWEYSWSWMLQHWGGEKTLKCKKQNKKRNLGRPQASSANLVKLCHSEHRVDSESFVFLWCHHWSVAWWHKTNWLNIANSVMFSIDKRLSSQANYIILPPQACHVSSVYMASITFVLISANRPVTLDRIICMKWRDWW